MYLPKISDIKNFLKTHQQKLVLIVGFILVLLIGVGLGAIASERKTPPDVRIEQAFTPPNNTQNLPSTQSSLVSPSPASTTGDCSGKIKGNISSKGDKIYHVPGGSFYDRTTPEVCFNTEAEAQAAGFRKSSK